jgi:RimJ/RimL family protein N-acetyltransferase
VPDLHLGPFGRPQLALVEAWFDDADTRRWLGGRSWPGLMLDLADQPLGEFRGAKETGRHRWLSCDGGRPVGYIDCGTYDRWTTWEGGPAGRGVVATLEVPAGSLSYVVDPVLRRRGYATAMVRAAVDRPELKHVDLFAAGVEPDNLASIGCLLKAGFGVLDPTPDWEGIIYYGLRRGDRE